MESLAYGCALALLLFAAGDARGNCSCQCVEGTARTVCTQLDEARANTRACGVGGRTVACAAAPVPVQPPQRYEAPSGAADCRERRLFDPKTNAYTAIAKVCDLATAPSS